MLRKLGHWAVIVCLPAVFLALPHRVAAAAPVQGLTINPALKNIAIQPQQTTVSFLVTLENDSDAAVKITPRASDFSTTGANAAISLKATADEAHGLASRIRFSQSQVTIEPGKNVSLGVMITAADTLRPGGHFAALRYQALPKDEKTAQVAMRAEITGFVFVTTPGRITSDVKTQWAMPSMVWGNLPSSTNLLFTNNGNAQAAPHGTVTITGSWQQRIAQGTLNVNSSLVLPGATRLIQTPLTGQHQALWPGRYTADLYYRATPSANYTHLERKFWFVGWAFLAIATAVVFVIIAYVRWLINQRKRKS